MVISCPSASEIPSSTAPCTWFSALLGLMMVLPMSPATQTFSIRSSPFGLTATCATSAK